MGERQDFQNVESPREEECVYRKIEDHCRLYEKIFVYERSFLKKRSRMRYLYDPIVITYLTISLAQLAHIYVHRPSIPMLFSGGG